MSTLDSPVSFDKTIRLPDRRSLGYADCGKHEGKPVFLFHSFPGSRLDAKFVEKAELKDIFMEDIRESFRQVTKGQAYEMRLYARPWGFRLEDINFDNVYLWHGELDKNVPVSMGRAVAEAIPKCQARLYPNEGHKSMIVNRAKEIMSTLLT
jgi:pimeloyl-ACP methyl ester carboxylesterase